MWLELRAWVPRNGAWLCGNKSKHWNFARLGVSGEFEAIREQRPHHQAHLIFGWISGSAGLNVEAIRHDPARQLRRKEAKLIAHQLVRKRDIRDEGPVRGGEQASVGRINGPR